MIPIFNGPPGIILLTLAVALGAYTRQVNVQASEIYDKIIGARQDDPYVLWPLDADYTQARLSNLECLMTQLRRIMNLMLLFVCFTALRLVATALNAAWMSGPLIPNTVFYIWDLALVVFFAFVFAVMWWTHAKSGSKERAYHKKMRAAVKERQDKLAELRPRAQ